jgi:hypothetical protein
MPLSANSQRTKPITKPSPQVHEFLWGSGSIWASAASFGSDAVLDSLKK